MVECGNIFIEPDQEFKLPPGKKRNKNAWARNVLKKLRNSGQEYKGSSCSRGARTLKDPCWEKCKLKCNLIETPKRQKLFDEYWALADIDSQRMFLASAM